MPSPSRNEQITREFYGTQITQPNRALRTQIRFAGTLYCFHSLNVFREITKRGELSYRQEKWRFKTWWNFQVYTLEPRASKFVPITTKKQA